MTTFERKCRGCGKVCYGWAEGPFARCPYCGSAELEKVLAARPFSAEKAEQGNIPARAGEEVKNGKTRDIKPLTREQEAARRPGEAVGLTLVVAL